MEWSRSDICKLIEIYRKKRCLWDPADPHFKDRNRKRNAYLEIARHMGLPGPKAEEKIRSLKGQYQRELKRLTNESGAAEGKQSKWFGFSLMAFLKDAMHPPREELAPFPEQHLEEQYPVESNEEVVDSEISRSSHQSNVSLEQHISAVFVPEHPEARICKQRNDGVAEDACSIKRRHISSIRTRDEFDVFGEHVAATIRNLKNRYDQATAKHRINNVLYEMEIGECSYRPQVEQTNLTENMSTSDVTAPHSTNFQQFSDQYDVKNVL